MYHNFNQHQPDHQIKRQMIANYPINQQNNDINNVNIVNRRNNYGNNHSNINPNLPQDNKFDINGFKIIQKGTDLSEEERLKEEIENLQREILEIENLNLPDDILNFDPIQLFQLQESFFEIPSIFLPDNAKKAGNMYAFFSYNNQVLDTKKLHTTKNLRIREISEIMSLAQGYQSTEMVGKTASFFSPLNQEADEELGRQVAELCKTNLTFLRIIGFSKYHNGTIFAFDRRLYFC
eukprot:TRINITY_DN14203_c0_g1_i1.p1 TRINITY_DN14203_c0_g1~~TRINITY_DN14203_c0_g1_i1.p1  ORF type:complete len:236 (-),score=35.45 TRINITY_DN14203_c0_g1_i1:145-852(-)